MRENCYTLDVRDPWGNTYSPWGTLLGVSESARSLSSAFVHQASLVFVDISGFTVIKMFQALIDALVEKEVIPEVFDELI